MVLRSDRCTACHQRAAGVHAVSEHPVLALAVVASWSDLFLLARARPSEGYSV